MKQPTSAKRGAIWQIVLVAALIGAASGALTSALTTEYLKDYGAELDQLSASNRLADVRPRAFPQSREEAIVKAQEDLVPSFVYVFDNAIAVLPTSVPYAPSRAIGRGAMLTADGWMAVHINAPSILPAERLAVMVNGEVAQVERTAYDASTGTTFVKASLSGQTTPAFGDALQLAPGDQLFAVPEAKSLRAADVARMDWGVMLTRSSDASSRHIEMAVADGLPNGTSVANVAAELVGFARTDEGGAPYILPLQAVLPAFRALLDGGDATRAYLGVTVVDLAHTPGFEGAPAGRNIGALLHSPSAVRPQSAAAEAGLLEGDVILSVDGQEVGNARTLDERLAEYAPGDDVTLRVLRGETEMDVRVVLKPAT